MEPLWTVRAGVVPYRRAWAWQRALVERRVAGAIPDTVLLLEHPHVYTIGKRGADADVLVSEEWLAAQGAEVVHSDRGGQVTYHGPGQLVGYPITLLEPALGVWPFIRRVEEALCDVAAGRVSRGVTSHGFALNCDTDLSKFNAIVPCGMPDKPACSLSSLLGRQVTVAEVLPLAERHLAERLGRKPVPVDLATLELPEPDPAAVT